MWNLNCQRGGKIQIHTIPMLFLFGQPGSRSNVLVALFLKEQVRLEQTVCKAVYRCPRCTGRVGRERRISQPHSCCTVHMCSELHDRAGKMMSYSPLKKKSSLWFMLRWLSVNSPSINIYMDSLAILIDSLTEFKSIALFCTKDSLLICFDLFPFASTVILSLPSATEERSCNQTVLDWIICKSYIHTWKYSEAEKALAF